MDLRIQQSRCPVIGITSGPDVTEERFGPMRRFRLGADYVYAVEAAGGIPLILPPRPESIETVLSLVDGLIFSGGADLDPALFGETELHPSTYSVDEERDTYELRLIREALDRDLPTLCICRGIQVLAVAFGGTLYQDIPSQVPGALTHRQYLDGKLAPEPTHAITATPGSLLERTYTQRTIPANSLHHQSVKDAGPSLVVEGTAEDGIIEAVSVPGRRFILGLQWHPEMMFAAHPLQLAPFSALIEEAARVLAAHPAD
jgi:putative glutamine amidotransferase